MLVYITLRECRDFSKQPANIGISSTFPYCLMNIFQADLTIRVTEGTVDITERRLVK
jgi:hypothetical protein